MEKEYYYSYAINRDEYGDIMSFEAVSGADLYDTARDVISLLKQTHDNREYSLFYNEIELYISYCSVIDTIINDYFIKNSSVNL